jgi:transposase
VDTDTVEVSVSKTKHRRRTIQERRQIVEETLQAGASVSRVARRYDVNANQVFYWRKLYREGRLGGGSTGARLLPVKIRPDQSLEAVKSNLAVQLGTMEIKLSKGTLRIAGAVDLVALQAVLECLAG